jgi:hypothetical protein
MMPKHPAGPPMMLGTWVHENSALMFGTTRRVGHDDGATEVFDLSDANVTRAVNELSGEMLECAVFFAIEDPETSRHNLRILE